MKLTFGVLAVLLFVTTMAIAETGSPFPQSANPGLRSSEGIVPLVVDQGYNADMPASMAGNEGAAIAPSVLDWHPRVDLGSPFPREGNPSLGSGSDQQESGNVELGEPFPEAGNPSRWER